MCVLKGELLTQTRYVLVVRVPRPVEVRIEDVYLHLAGATKPVMGFHITILGPFLFASGALPEFVASVTAVCRSWAPFSVSLSGLEAFREQDDNTIYLQIVDPQPLIALHDDLLAVVADLIVPQDERCHEWYITCYHPHVTLGLGLSDKELEAFLRAGETRHLKESFEVSSLWLAEQAPYGPWQYLTEFPFGSSAGSSESGLKAKGPR